MFFSQIKSLKVKLKHENISITNIQRGYIKTIDKKGTKIIHKNDTYLKRYIGKRYIKKTLK